MFDKNDIRSSWKQSNENDIGPSLTDGKHAFFERFLDNDLEKMTKFLQKKYDEINEGKHIRQKVTKDTFTESNSISTMNWYQYNVFQFYSPEIHKLAAAVKDMTQQACEYYSIDFEKQQYMLNGWFNICYTKKGKLDWHDHGGRGAPVFHGYYCVSAEPSTTHYKLFYEKEYENINKNNRAILSETGHLHAMADWDWEGPRITVAYDVIPLEYLLNIGWQEQHWIPLV